MSNKRAISAGFFTALLIASTFAFSYILYEASGVSAATSEASYCCEKTTSGAYCVNAPSDECSSSYRSSPTSCETTSYCKLGTCYDSEEGICMENTPQVTCESSGGTWDERDASEIAQCQLGCCIIGDQAAFVPLVRCKRLSTLFGIENDYRTDIDSEVECIAEAQSQDVGACVYELDYERVCEFTTRGECDADEVVESTSEINGTEGITTTSEKKFYKDYLCSAEELNTVCAKQATTKCYNGKVYWFDSCGNRENVYSSNKEVSWNNGRVADPEDVCDANDGSDENCGNCDYLLGSRCAEWDGVFGIGSPDYGDSYCKDNTCTDRDGNERVNGEAWCYYDDEDLVGEGSDPIGSRYFREICVDGDVVVEACEDYRNEICIESSIETTAGDFSTAACSVNRWQDCLTQDEKEDCENADRRDCMWIGEIEGFPVTETNGGICVPYYSPGQEFWDDEGEGEEICGQITTTCTAVYEETLYGGSKCVENCDCVEDEWAVKMNQICAAVGDCGGYINYAGEYTDDGYKWVEDGDSKEFNQNTINQISRGFTGLVVSAITGSAVAPITGYANYILLSAEGGGGEWVDLSTQEVVKTVTAEEYSSLLSSGDAFLSGAEASTYFGGGTITGTGGGGLSSLELDLMANPPKAANVVTQTPNTVTAAGTSSNLVSTVAAKDQILNIASTGQKVQISSGEVIQAGRTYSTVDGGSYTLTEGDVKLISTQKQEYGSTASEEMFSKIGVAAGGAWDAIISGAQWALVAYGLGYTIGTAIGLEGEQVQALSTSLAAGTFIFKGLTTWNPSVTFEGVQWAGFGSTTSGAWAAAGIGAVVAAGVFIAMYKEIDEVTVTFECLPWQAPSGGNDCELCNGDDLHCSEYRCKALGQSCELVNEGTDQEMCVYVNPKDVNQPVISPDTSEVTAGYEYTNVEPNPPNAGFEIVDEDDGGCIAAFTSVSFGVTVDEPAQCKIDYNHTTSFDDMNYFMGGSNQYSYNHTETILVPSLDNLDDSLVLENGNEMNFFIRCKDKNGNENSAEYNVRFCVDESPDNTAPQIKATSIDNGGCVSEDTNAARVDFYINEPADCRWSKEDQDYDSMTEEMKCNNKLYQLNALQLYTCQANLTGIGSDNTEFYVRCKDQPTADESDRNENAESYEFSLRGSAGLKLKTIAPNGTIFGSTDPAPVEFYVQTLYGCNTGRSICYYSATGDEDDYIMFYDTDNDDGISTQTLYLESGDQEYYVKCVDEGGNLIVNKTEFTVDIDTDAPVIARIYEQDELLKLVTVRDSECAYSLADCDFEFDEGIEMPYANSTVHVVDWDNTKTYYIKCRDEFRNAEADCSAIVRPTVNFF